MEYNAFSKNFGNRNMPQELISLFAFQNEMEYFSQQFYLLEDDKSGIKTWSEDENFLAQLMPFAQANGSGSTYGLWEYEAGKPLNELPILVFGDEGGVHIIAENILGLMQLLTFDADIYVDHDDAHFYKDEDDEDYEASEYHEEYVQWLKENFNLDAIDDAEPIIEKAQEKYKAAFDKWFANYYSDL